MAIELDKQDLKVIRLDNGEIIFSKVVVNDNMEADTAFSAITTLISLIPQKKNT